jgi:hypothetical protein
MFSIEKPPVKIVILQHSAAPHKEGYGAVLSCISIFYENSTKFDNIQFAQKSNKKPL